MRDSWITRAWTRRQALRTAAASAAVVAGGASLAACAGSGSAKGGSSAAPQPAAGAAQLLFQANRQGMVQWNKTTIDLYQQFVDENFNTNPKYKGIWAKVDPGGWGNAQSEIADTIAGSGYADIFMVCCTDVPTLMTGGYLQALDPLLRRDNIATSLWNQGHLQADSNAGSIYGLPAYDGTTVVFYRQDILDQLGLQYPDPSWTYKDAAQIWAQCAGNVKDSGGKTSQRYGVSLYWSGGYEQMNWWYHGWGTSPMNADRTQATMYSPQGVDCVSYAIDMVKNKVAANRSDIAHLAAGAYVFEMGHSDHVIDSAVLLGNKYKWDILPMPMWPVNKSTFNTIDMYGINKATKHPDEAWELLKWIQLGTLQGDGTYDYSWPKFQIQTNLITPSVLSLWDYWLEILPQTAPPLKGKGLKWFKDAAVNNYAYPGYFFAQGSVQASNLMNTIFTQIWNGQVSVALGLQQMQNQINALQAAAAQENVAAQGVSKQFPTTGPAIAAVTPGL